MVEEDASQLVKPLAKGQITIPARFRRALGIDADTYLRITLEGRRLMLTPVRVVDADEIVGRDYTTANWKLSSLRTNWMPRLWPG